MIKEIVFFYWWTYFLLNLLNYHERHLSSHICCPKQCRACKEWKLIFQHCKSKKGSVSLHISIFQVFINTQNILLVSHVEQKLERFSLQLHYLPSIGGRPSLPVPLGKGRHSITSLLFHDVSFYSWGEVMLPKFQKKYYASVYSFEAN